MQDIMNNFKGFVAYKNDDINDSISMVRFENDFKVDINVMCDIIYMF